MVSTFSTNPPEPTREKVQIVLDKYARAIELDRWVRSRATQLSHVTKTIMLWGQFDLHAATDHLPDPIRSKLQSVWEYLESDAVRGLAYSALREPYDYFRSTPNSVDRDRVLVCHWLLTEEKADPTLLGLPPMPWFVSNRMLPDGRGRAISRMPLACLMLDMWKGWADTWNDIVQDAMKTIEGESDAVSNSTQEVQTDPPPLVGNQRAVYELLIAQPPHVAMTAPEICKALVNKKPRIYVDENGLRKHIVPLLKDHYGLENHKNKGYRIPVSARPPAIS